MAKIDKSQYSKAEWHRIREQRRQEKVITSAHAASPDSACSQYNLVCVKQGKKYSAEYVNTLYRMAKRNCSLDFEFICVTDDTKNLVESIKTIPLANSLKGWWAKPYIFSNDLGLKGTILYMDLDVVIAGNIDKLFTHSPYQWFIIRDFTRAMRPNWQKYNSSVIRFNAGQLDHLWQDFKHNQIMYQKKILWRSRLVISCCRPKASILARQLDTKLEMGSQKKQTV